MKIISLFFIFFSFLFAKLEIFATSVKEVNKTIFLKNPIIFYKDFVIQSKNGKVKNKIIYLSKDVIAFYKNSAYLVDKAVIYNKKNIALQDIFLIDKSNDIWIKAKEGKFKDEIVDFKNLIFSSCCIKNPDWYLFAKEGSYNKSNKYLKLYNITLYIGRVPVFYLPFYFNSLNKKRRSGLLRPYIGFSAKEGILYSQPLYIVLGDSSDLEITPTIRSLRGKGVYNTFRFITSPFDYGEIKFGEFIDKNSFIEKYNLANKKHYGFEIFYKRDKVFSNDKLYLNFKKANDVDYFYLNPYNYTFDTKYLVDKIITSKLNYINEFDKDYILGVYAKYFLDTTKKSNDDTIQLLPQFNIHKFETDNFIINSFDFNYYNYTSKNKKYYQYDFSLPISYNVSFFKDYLKLKISENFNYSQSNYYYSNKNPQKFYQIYSSIKVYTSLTKKSSFVHIINPSLTLNLKQKSYISKNSNLLSYTKNLDSFNFSLFQLFEYNNLYITHTLNQNFDDKFKANSFFENKININYNNVSISDMHKYSWSVHRSIYNIFNFSFLLNRYKFDFSYIFNYPEYSNLLKSYTLKVEKSLNSYKKLYLKYNYDLTNKYYKYILIGIKLNKKCWQYEFSLKKERIPILKESGISFDKNYMLTFNVNFYPIGGIKQSIEFQ